MPDDPLTHATAQGQRSEQQDRWVASPISEGLLLAVMDGHGGTRTAEILATHLTASFELALKSNPNSIESLKSAIQRLAQRTSIEPSGSTLSVVFLPKNKKEAFVAILGDSPVLIRDSKGSWHFSPLHNARSHPQELAAAVARGARYSEGYLEDPQVPGRGLQMSRSLGDRELDRIVNREPEVYAVALGSSSLIILATDGVLDSFDSSIHNQLQRIAELAETCKTADDIVQDALKRQTGDNVTAIIWKA